MTEFIFLRILKFIGRKLDGYKTIIGGLGFMLTGIMGIIRIMFPDLTQFPDMSIGEAIVAISAGMTAIGLGAKVEKGVAEIKKGNEIVDDR